MRMRASALIVLTLVTACGPSPEIQARLAEMDAVSAAKDSLLIEVSENTRMMSEISGEIARVQAAAAEAATQEGPIEVTRERVLAGIRDVTARLEASEARLAQSEARMQTLSRENASLTSSVATMRQTVEDLRATIDNQRESITTLTAQVEQLREENTRLTVENVTLAEERTALADTIVSLERRDNTAYYVIGTKDELIEKGLITEQGGSRVLFIFGRTGETLVPALELDPAAFTQIDLRQVTEIPLPWADRDYRIVSRQNIAALGMQPDEDGDFRGSITIADPTTFWAASRFLIVVER